MNQSLLLLLLVVFVACCWMLTVCSNSHHIIPLSPAITERTASARAALNRGMQLQRPVWWHGPFLSGIGYSTDALGLALGLHHTRELGRSMLWLSQHSDWAHSGARADLSVQEGLQGEAREELLDLLALGRNASFQKDRSALVVCHSPPGCWSLPKPLAEFYEGESPCPPYPLEEATYVIGRTMAETDSLSESWVERLNSMHELWVPCEHNKEVFASSGVTRPRLVVMPPVVDVDTYDPDKHQPLTLSGLPTKRVLGRALASHSMTALDGAAKPFIFLSMFVWGPRKGWEVLLEAYLQEFRSRGQRQQTERREQEVALVLRLGLPRGAVKASPSEDDSGDDDLEDDGELSAYLEGSEMPVNPIKEMRRWVEQHLNTTKFDEALPPVYYITDFLPQEQLPGLYRMADSFVLPSRGEGWGLPIVEAMSMGLPVIATNWSAMVDYLDESVGYPLAIDGLEPVPLEQWHKWAKPSVAHLRQLMRQVVEQRGEAAARGAAARARMQERYAPEVVGRRVLARMQEIDSELPAPAGRASIS